MATEAIFTRSRSAVEMIERLIGDAMASIDAALYRFNNPRLSHALHEAAGRGVVIRVALNYNDHYEENRAIQQTLSNCGIPFRLLHGRQGLGTKMHHKFVILDGRTALTGSYNWTVESDEKNYENMLVLTEPRLVEAYRGEFEALWAEGQEASEIPSG